jgi:pre-rRNA-processing protein TSR3
MGSSGSTQPPSREGPLALFLEVTGDDHPRACTGRRLLQRGLARPAARARAAHPAPVVLDPYANAPLSLADLESTERGGLLAVDCSWNRLATRGHLEGGYHGSRAGRRRRLPFLVAANPQHYGRVAELNTVEALSAALYLLGRRSQAAALLEGFRGGAGFLEVNRERLDAYAAAPDSEAIVRLERTLFGVPSDPNAPAEGDAPISRTRGRSDPRWGGARSPRPAPTRAGGRGGAGRR